MKEGRHVLVTRHAQRAQVVQVKWLAQAPVSCTTIRVTAGFTKIDPVDSAASLWSTGNGRGSSNASCAGNRLKKWPDKEGGDCSLPIGVGDCNFVDSGKQTRQIGSGGIVERRLVL